MYNIVNGTLDFPIGYFVQNYFPYCSSHGILNLIIYLFSVNRFTPIEKRAIIL